MHKKFFFGLIFIGLLFSSCSVTGISLAQSGQIIVKVTDDTHVDSTNPDSTLGTQKYLDIELYDDASTSYQQMIWLKFSLVDVPDGVEFNQATLDMYAWFTDGNLVVNAYFCSDNSWSESKLTYQNMPVYNINSICSTVVDKSEAWYSWNIIEAVRNAYNNGAKFVTIVLNEPKSSSQNSIYLYSKETPSLVTDVSPKLTLSWSPTTSLTPKPTTQPSSTAKTPTPSFTPSSSNTLPTNWPSPTPESQGSTDWAVWGTLILVIITIFSIAGYSIIRMRKKQLPIPPPPPPP